MANLIVRAVSGCLRGSMRMWPKLVEHVAEVERRPLSSVVVLTDWARTQTAREEHAASPEEGR
jgi:hypothetical protein